MNIQHQNLFFDPSCDPESHTTPLEVVVNSWVNEMGKICNNVFNPISASTIDSLRTCYINNYLARIQENPKFKEAI